MEQDMNNQGFLKTALNNVIKGPISSLAGVALGATAIAPLTTTTGPSTDPTMLLSTLIQTLVAIWMVFKSPGKTG